MPSRPFRRQSSSPRAMTGGSSSSRRGFPFHVFLAGMAAGAYLTRLSGAIFYTEDYLKEINKIYDAAASEVSHLSGLSIEIQKTTTQDTKPTNNGQTKGDAKPEMNSVSTNSGSTKGDPYREFTIPDGGICPGDIRASLPDTRPDWDRSLPYPGWKPLPAKEIVDFERQDRVVISTKMPADNMAFMLEQMLCLLTKAYNDRTNYDFVIFIGQPWSDEAIKKSEDVVAPARIKFVVDNPGLHTMVERLPDDIKKSFFQRCNITNYPENLEKLNWYTECTDIFTRGKSRISYNWQAEFRSLHIWNHPALKDYDWMMWLDADGFCTEKWKVDPVAYAIRNNLVMLFDNFPQGMQGGKDWDERLQTAMGHSVCGYTLLDDGRISWTNECAKGSKIKDIHGFFHITSLNFFRSEPVMFWQKTLIGRNFLTRRYDDQVSVSVPTVVFAQNYTRDMRKSNLTMNVFHNHKIDGKEGAGGFKGWWGKYGKERFPEAYGICEILAAG